MRFRIDVGAGTISLEELRDRFPAIEFELGRAQAPAATVTADAWRAEDFDLRAFDRMLDRIVALQLPLVIVARAKEATAVVEQIAIRAQRLAPRRNAATSTPWFDRVLEEHRALHDTHDPLVRAEYDHGLDTWQWTLRRDQHVSATVQLAALLHGVQHLAGGREHVQVKEARASAQIAAGVLARARVPAKLATGAAALIACHERTWPNPLSRALHDADALSFFSLHSAGYVVEFGEQPTATKVTATLARMSADARRELAAVRLPRLVQELLSRRSPCDSSSSGSR